MVRLDPAHIIRSRPIMIEEARRVFQDWERVKGKIFEGIKWKLDLIDEACFVCWTHWLEKRFKKE